MATKTSAVFGVATNVRLSSYVDRGDLDSKITTALERDNHVSLRGASKSGKSWLRQKLVPDAIVIQCRLGKTVEDIYKEALGLLGISLTISESNGGTFSGQVEASAEFGKSLIAKVAAKLVAGYSNTVTQQTKPVSQDINDLRFVSELILISGRRLVIEDVHYLALVERRRLAYDLKALWDYGLFVIIVGIWRQQSLIDLNSDLANRVKEFSIQWSEAELEEILYKGASVLNIEFSGPVQSHLVQCSYENAGLLQSLVLGALDDAGVDERQAKKTLIESTDHVDNAAMELAENLNTLYQSFARRTSTGIRNRKNSTGIYAHAMAVIMSQGDNELIRGVSLREVFRLANEREPRILLANLRTILQKIDGLQIDKDGRGLVVTFDEGREEVVVVDLQVLLYRRFATVSWPWEDLVAETQGSSDVFEADPTLF